MPIGAAGENFLKFRIFEIHLCIRMHKCIFKAIFNYSLPPQGGNYPTPPPLNRGLTPADNKGVNRLKRKNKKDFLHWRFLAFLEVTPYVTSSHRVFTPSSPVVTHSNTCLFASRFFKEFIRNKF